MNILDYTAEETALIAIYHDGTRTGTITAITAALPDMDIEIQSIATSSAAKLAAMSDGNFAAATFFLADDMDDIA